MKSNINIRKVENGDANILAYIQTESWKSAFFNILDKEDLDKYTNLDTMTEMYNSLLNENIGNGYILSIDDRPHCIAYWDQSKEDKYEEYAEIICIHSLYEDWGKGYGSIMMDFILDDIKINGFSKVILWVFEENHRAINFYKNRGFILSNPSKKFCNATEVMYSKDI